MILNWLDYSWGRPSPASMKVAGIRGASRYLWRGGKGLTKPELDELHATGLGVLANYEADAGMVLEGATAAREHTKAAVGLAEELEWPAGKVIVHSVDRDLVTGSDFLTMGNFFDAANHNAGAYAVGAYGEADVLDWLFARGLATFGWQTKAWSNRRTSDHAHLHQFSIDNLWGGTAVDFNQILNPAAVTAAAWFPPGPAGKPAESADAPAGGTTQTPPPVHHQEHAMYELIRNVESGAVRAAGPNYWMPLEGKTDAQTRTNISRARTSPLCANNGIVRDVSDAGMTYLKHLYTGK